MVKKHFAKQEALLSFPILEPVFGGSFKSDVLLAEAFVRIVKELNSDLITVNIDKAAFDRQAEKGRKAEEAYKALSPLALKNVREDVLNKYRLFMEKIKAATSRIDGKAALQVKLDNWRKELETGYRDGITKAVLESYKKKADEYNRNAEAIRDTLTAAESQKLFNVLTACKDFVQKLTLVWSDTFTGKGARIYGNGDRYVGDFKNGKHDGRGTYAYASGSRYVGDFKNGQYNGKGTYTWANGDNYVGEWKDAKRSGKGKMTFLGKEEYDGDWENDIRKGKGRQTFANGDVYVGDFKNDKREGNGTYTYKNGDRYVGEWKNDNRHGEGELIAKKGKSYKGDWENDQYQPEGRYSRYLRAVGIMNGYSSTKYAAAMKIFATILDYRDSRTLWEKCQAEVKKESAARRKKITWEIIGSLLFNLAFSATPFLFLLFDSLWYALAIFPVICLVHAALVHEFEGETFVATAWFCKGITMGLMSVSTVICMIISNNAGEMPVVACVFFGILSLGQIGIFECLFSMIEASTYDDLEMSARIWTCVEFLLIFIAPLGIWLLLRHFGAMNMWHTLWIPPAVMLARSLLEMIPMKAGELQYEVEEWVVVIDVITATASLVFTIVLVSIFHGFHFGILMYYLLAAVVYAGVSVGCAAIRKPDMFE